MKFTIEMYIAWSTTINNCREKCAVLDVTLIQLNVFYMNHISHYLNIVFH